MNSYVYKIKYEVMQTGKGGEFFVVVELPHARIALGKGYNLITLKDAVVTSVELYGLCRG